MLLFEEKKHVVDQRPELIFIKELKFPLLKEVIVNSKRSIIVLLSLVMLFVAGSAYAFPVEVIPYQRIVNSNAGTKTCIFRIYDAASGGNLLWQEPESGTVS